MNKRGGITKYILWIALGIAIGVWFTMEFIK